MVEYSFYIFYPAHIYLLYVIATLVSEMGCEIVGHSWDYRNLSKLSGAEIEAELSSTNSVIESVIGKSSGIYRPPCGVVSGTLKNVSKDMGFSILDWSIDTRDWQTKNAMRFITP